MDYLQVLKVFRKYYGKNQKYYSNIHSILYYNDEFYTNPFLKTEEEKEELKNDNLKKYFNEYKLGINRSNFFKLFLTILRKNNYHLNEGETVNKMIYDFDKLNLASEYKLREKYKITKIIMRNIIINENFNSWEFIQFCSDYFRFKIILIDENNIKYYNPRDNIKNLSPKLYVYKDENNRFHQILIDENDWIDSENKNYVRKDEMKEEIKEESEIEKEVVEIKYDCKKLIKMKLSQLQEIATSLNINIEKMNPKKTRMIKKRKDELVSEIIRENT
jgi:hypothetical protein